MRGLALTKIFYGCYWDGVQPDGGPGSPASPPFGPDERGAWVLVEPTGPGNVARTASSLVSGACTWPAGCWLVLLGPFLQGNKQRLLVLSEGSNPHKPPAHVGSSTAVSADPPAGLTAVSVAPWDVLPEAACCCCSCCSAAICCPRRACMSTNSCCTSFSADMTCAEDGRSSQARRHRLARSRSRCHTGS